jgi:hypothetical protein
MILKIKHCVGATLVLSAFYFCSLVSAQSLETEYAQVITKGAAVMDKKFSFENQAYTLSDSLSPYLNITIRADFDGDRRQETLVGFQAYAYTSDFKVPVAFIAIGKEVRGRFDPELLMGNEYFKRIELYDIDGDKLPEILFWSEGGAHFVTLDIYKYQRGALQRIFGNASACSIEFEKDPKKPRIKIGREQWEKTEWTYKSGNFAYEIWEWDGSEFRYDEDSSTSKPL